MARYTAEGTYKEEAYTQDKSRGEETDGGVFDRRAGCLAFALRQAVVAL